MEHPMAFPVASLLGSILIVGSALAQTSAAPPRPTEPPANDRVGISIDRFIGDASRAPSRVSHDVMFTRSILRTGDPLQPGEVGAVLRYNHEIVVATLPAKNATPLTRVPRQLIFIVQGGAGRLDDGERWWELRPGIAALVPPELAHRLTNTGDAPLQMLMLSRDLEPAVTPRTSVLVRDIDRLALTERNVHWSNMAKYVFSGARTEDGLHWADRVYIVYMGPMTIAGPHAHTEEQEEVWIKLTDGDALMQLGSEIRPWPINAGFLAPPNGQTVHAAINVSDDIQAWLYFARLNPNASPPNPNTPPRTGNPVIEEALQRATLPGQPLE
jgi:mannose-6-phosphate isomerase-like protein (cupin superfamily)